jgi:CRP-like cAMP-binding protein
MVEEFVAVSMSLFPISDMGLLAGFSSKEMAEISASLEWIDAPPDTILFEQGEIALHLYLVVSGEVNVYYKPDDGPALVVSRVRGQPGQEGVVGWSAAIGSPTYTSAAECSTACAMLRIRTDDLRSFCLRNPRAGARLLDRLAAMIVERMRNTHGHVLTLLEQGLRIPVTPSVNA